MERELDDSRERIDDHEGRLMQRFRDDQAAEQNKIDAAKKQKTPEPTPPSVAPSRVDEANHTAQSVPQSEWAKQYEIRREARDGGGQVWAYYRDGNKQFSDQGTRIVSHVSSEKATRDYVALVKERYGENIKLTGGSPERQDAIMREMARQGVRVGNPELSARYEVIAAEVKQQQNQAADAKPVIYTPPKHATEAQRAQDAAQILATSPDASLAERQRAKRVAANLEQRLDGQPTLSSLRAASGIKYDDVEMRVRARMQAPHLIARVSPNAGPPHKPAPDPKPARPRHSR